MNGRNRRRKDVPFNPFAPNAVAERNRRQAERAKEKRRQDAQNVAGTTTPAANDNSGNKSLDELRKKAQQKLSVEEQKVIVEPVVQETIVEPVKPTPVKEAVIEEPKTIEVTESKEEIIEEIIPVITQNSEEDLAPKIIKPSRNERLAELKRKSQQSKDNAKARKASLQTESVNVSDGLLNNTDGNPETEVSVDRINPNNSLISDEININVFKTIQSVDKKSAGISKKKRKSRRIDKKGGGRQRMEKKIKKEKILEFKYVARNILDNPDVPEEHRSNILGQIIAKGERISIEAALEFIEQKNLELILTDEISDKLKSEIKSITTRR